MCKICQNKKRQNNWDICFASKITITITTQTHAQSNQNHQNHQSNSTHNEYLKTIKIKHATFKDRLPELRSFKSASSRAAIVGLLVSWSKISIAGKNPIPSYAQEN